MYNSFGDFCNGLELKRAGFHNSLYANMGVHQTLMSIQIDVRSSVLS